MARLRKRRGRVYPAPEVVKKQEWKVGPITARDIPRTDVSGGIMLVPLDESALSAHTRLHEMAHVRWSPPEVRYLKDRLPPDTPLELLQFAEDARLNHLLELHGLQNPGVPFPEAEGLVKRILSSPMGAVEALDFYVATARSAIGSKFLEALSQEDKELAVELKQWVEGATEGWDPHKYSYTIWLCECLLHFHQEHAKRREKLEELAQSMPDLGEEEAGNIAETLSKLEGDYGEGGRWGEMVIVRPNLMAPYQVRPAYSQVPYDEGVVPSNFHRLLVDGAVFERKKRRMGGGTLLIDTSDSMASSSSGIDELMHLLPLVRIATYSSESTNGPGYLYIVADKGRRCHPQDLKRHTYNVIDGPALRWLVQQPKPWLWVSDGGVTGTGDHQYSNLNQEVASLVKRYRIVRLEGVPAAKEYIREGNM